MWKKRLQILLWCLLGCTCVVLLVAAMQAKDRKVCSDIKIDLDDAGDHVFVDTAEIGILLQKNNVVKGRQVENIPLGLVEKELEKNVWIKDAQLFFDNNQLLTVKIIERQPLARVFTVSGKSFYIDSAAKLLPISARHAARVPVFTSFPLESDTLRHADSVLLHEVKNIALYIQNDSFWMAQVAQVDITPQRTYQIIPVLGNQLINLGTAEGIGTKFKKLYAFYKQVWSKAGFEKYSAIDVQYEGQVVAVKRGAMLNAVDSTQPAVGASAGLVAGDSLRISNPPKPQPNAGRDTVARGIQHTSITPTLPPKRGTRQAAHNAQGTRGANGGKKPPRAVMRRHRG